MAGMSAIRVLLVDDDPLVREGLAMMLHGAGEITVVGQAGDGDEIPRGTSAATVDVVLMDLRMRRQGGLEATRRLREQPHPPEVIVLTTFDSDHNVLEALRLGASGFLLKDSPPDEIARAVRSVAAGDPILSPAITRRLMDRAAEDATTYARSKATLARLTPRERQIVEALARGRTNAEIAADLHLSTATIKAHISRLLDKLGMNNRTQVALLAQEAGL
ncbi:MAG TPA: response regulator transcription factor [Actinophytocola sp.]|nr:response regulator transcription factor [Actinophytocola sp.]